MKIILNHRFIQKEYLTDIGMKGEDCSGLCITLCAKWCHMILSDKMDGWANPTTPASERFRYFYSPIVYEAIAKEQGVCNARLKRLRANKKGMVKIINIANIMGAQGLYIEREPLFATLKDSAPKLNATLSRIPRQILSRFGCKKVGHPVEINWGGLAKSFEAKKCYAIIFNVLNQSQHAISVYVSSGVINKDYHFFEPNGGEYKADCVEAAQKFLNNLAVAYNKPKVARMFEMQL